MKVTPYNKLVRDKIPSIIQAAGKTPVVEVLSQVDYIRMLHLKLREELDEYLESENVEELADLAEVMLAILTYQGISVEKISQIRVEKLQKRGGFSERLLLVAVQEDE